MMSLETENPDVIEGLVSNYLTLAYTSSQLGRKAEAAELFAKARKLLRFAEQNALQEEQLAAYQDLS